MRLSPRQHCCGDENNIAAGEKQLHFISYRHLPPHPSPLPAGERDGVRGNVTYLFMYLMPRSSVAG